ncbi:hypothetical protein HDU98_004866 [Podochytrium sp. JEL0797]|nr:hypothetical protein HDU98_004866 [Podochytrium sp. JEL0797]
MADSTASVPSTSTIRKKSQLYIRYKDYTAVAIDTSYGRGPQQLLPLLTVAHLIAAAKTAVAPLLDHLSLAQLTLHSVCDGVESDALEPDVLLSAVPTGFTAKTALVIKTVAGKRSSQSSAASSPASVQKRSRPLREISEVGDPELVERAVEANNRTVIFEKSVIARDNHCVVTKDYSAVQAAHILAHAWLGDYANRKGSLPQDIRTIISDLDNGINNVRNGVLLRNDLAVDFDKGHFSFKFENGHYHFSDLQPGGPSFPETSVGEDNACSDDDVDDECSGGLLLHLFEPSKAKWLRLRAEPNVRNAKRAAADIAAAHGNKKPRTNDVIDKAAFVFDMAGSDNEVADFGDDNGLNDFRLGHGLSSLRRGMYLYADCVEKHLADLRAELVFANARGTSTEHLHHELTEFSTYLAHPKPSLHGVKFLEMYGTMPLERRTAQSQNGGFGTFTACQPHQKN